MGQCVTCNKFLGPNYCITVNEDTDEKQCVFCYLEKDEITVEDDNGNQKKLKKEEAVKKYREFLNKIKRSDRVQNILKDNNESNIIKP
ncbi:MAG: hypothetical protein ACOCP8_01655 [archaeon]